MDIPERQKEFMRRAISLSREKMNAGAGGPFGAVIVKGDRIIGEGWNRVTSANDPTAHAEVTAIRAACTAENDFSLDGCDIYTSCEPCPMCLAAIYWARIGRIYYANTRKDAAAIGFDDDFLYREVALPLEKREKQTLRLLSGEALEVFGEWEKKADKIRY
ncbi:MAG: nucleoside deaminase [Alphaproteobacteria bacterium]|nr:nucleoside deaminase [Alphaproteobacteria bacterium]MDE2335874.1 nucleoside deaminase [Alphaproteobacteria bacterium]